MGTHSTVAQSIALHNVSDVAVIRLGNRFPALVNGQMSFNGYFRGIYGGNDASLHNKQLMLFGYGWNSVNCTVGGTDSVEYSKLRAARSLARAEVITGRQRGLVADAQERAEDAAAETGDYRQTPNCRASHPAPARQLSTAAARAAA
jgi:hypothetical protein